MSLKAKLIDWARYEERAMSVRYKFDILQEPPVPWSMAQTSVFFEVKRSLRLNAKKRCRPLVLQALPKSGGSWLSIMLSECLDLAKCSKRSIKALPASDMQPWKMLHSYFTDLVDLKSDTLSQYENKPALLHAHLAPTDRNIEYFLNMVQEPVYVHRDLCDVLVSWYFHLSTLDNELGREIKSKEEQEGIDLVIDNFLMPFHEFNRNWLSFFEENYPKRIICYEELINEPNQTFSRLIADIDNTIPQSRIVDVLCKYCKPKASNQVPAINLDPSKLRKGIVGDSRNFLSDSQVERIRHTVSQCG
jgi:hypothetical protein